jgi:plasmid stability protein
MEDMATLNIKNFPDRLYRKVKQLADRENRSVAQQVIQLLNAAIGKPELESIMSLRGLGKELWAGIDPATHVNTERKAWD